MVQILPRYDPGGQFGQALGSGISEVLGVQADRSRMVGALDALKDLDKPIEYMGKEGETLTRQPTWAEKLTTLTKAGAGIPGWMNVVETLAPALMKQQQGQAAATGLDVLGGEDAEGQAPRGQAPSGQLRRGQPPQREARPGQAPQPAVQPAQPTAPPTVDTLLQGEQAYADQPYEIDQTTISSLPYFNENRPAYDVPDRKQIQKLIKSYTEAGRSPEDAYDLVQKDLGLQKEAYQAQITDWDRRLKEFDNERNLEVAQRTFVDDKAQDFFRSKGFADAQGNVQPYYKDLAYDIYNKNRAEMPRKTDQKVWSQSRKQVGQILEHEASADKATRPLIPIDPRATGAVDRTTRWVQDYYNVAGNTPEVRDHLSTILTNNGWSTHMVKEYTQPFSEGISKTFNKLPKLAERLAAPSAAGMVLASSTAKKNKQRMEQIRANVPQMAKEFTNEDSLFLLRDNLVRKKGLSQVQANEIINQIGEAKGGWAPYQSKELNLLGESPFRDVWRIFYDLM